MVEPLQPTQGRDRLAEHLEGGRTLRFYFLTRGLYQDTKPYMITFDPGEFGIEKTNHEYTEHGVLPINARSSMSVFDIGKHGFQFEPSWNTCLGSSDFDDESKIKGVYYPEIIEHVRRSFPHFTHVEPIEHLRRKAFPALNHAADHEPHFPGPATAVHAAGANVAVRPLLEANPLLLSKHVSMINVWRVTQGPNEDWPLALCDFRTIRQEDVETSDVIHRGSVGESARLYFHGAQRWYFLANQDVNEVVVFRNADTSQNALPVAFHTAFKNPYAPSGRGRESIEIRLACFYD
ncbi:hypothetical protein F4859DRAFT_140936 [Xylaria cf. heliscus]|nr:hypothetical protein F4859DRAFT_140936 [Xylaria cf. heliscus]